MLNRLSRLAVGALYAMVIVLVVTAAPGARAEESPLDRARAIKQIEREMLLREGRERIEHRRARMAQARLDRDRQSAKQHHGEAELGPEGEGGARGEALGEAREAGQRRRRAWIESRSGTVLAPNVRASNPAGDDPDASQNEPSIAVKDNHVLVAFNDLPGRFFLGSTQGYAYSIDGGASFIDGGELPAPADTTFWDSDPVLAVDEVTGEFYYIGLLETLENIETGANQNGIAIARATFSGSGMAWDIPRIVHLESSSDHFIDKPWLAVDGASGYIYITYTDYTDFGNSIMFTRSANRGVSWTNPVVLNPPDADGKVQGARPVIGPNGELYVVWKEIGPESPGSDFMRIRASGDHGVTFDVQRTVATFFDNYGTGAPAFNRERAVALPSVAVDRTTGPNRGRIYVTWNESLNWYDDIPASPTTINEAENNDFFSRATPFVIGQALGGTFRDSVGFDDYDLDYFQFNADAGSSYLFWSDNVPNSLYTMRVFCSDTLSRLAFAGQLDAPIDPEANQSIMMWTCPASGAYYLRMAYVDGGNLGPYHVRTGFADRGPGDRGRDQRDVFVTSSPNGVGWTDPTRVNDDAALYDNWLPEVAVSGFGTVYATWYDWRAAPPTTCGSVSQLYLAASDAGGTSWNSMGPLSDSPSAWTTVASNLAPNQGDYTALFSNDSGVFATWTDGRAGTPDIYTAAITAVPESLQVSASASSSPGLISLTWQFRVGRPLTANLYRSVDGGAPVLIGPVDATPAGLIVYDDTDILVGSLYQYSLGVQSSGKETLVGLVSAVATAGRLMALPNPLSRITTIQYDVDSPGGPVELTIYDLQGRTISRPVRGDQPPGPKQVVWEARDLVGNPVKAGLYLVRLKQNGKTSTIRINLVP